MNIWTIEVAGNPVVAFSTHGFDEEEDEALAEKALDDGPIFEDLTVFDGEDGKPIMNEGDKLALRLSNIEERQTWQRSFDSADYEPHLEDEADHVVFLVPVTDPTDDA